MKVDEMELSKIFEKAQKYDELLEYKNKKEVCCDFCGKSQSQVEKIICRYNSYPRVTICNECVEICNDILRKNKES